MVISASTSKTTHCLWRLYLERIGGIFVVVIVVAAVVISTASRKREKDVRLPVCWRWLIGHDVFLHASRQSTTRKTVQFICDYEEKNQPKEEMLLIYDGNVGERFFRKTMISL